MVVIGETKKPTVAVLDLLSPVIGFSGRVTATSRRHAQNLSSLQFRYLQGFCTSIVDRAATTELKSNSIAIMGVGSSAEPPFSCARVTDNARGRSVIFNLFVGVYHLEQSW